MNGVGHFQYGSLPGAGRGLRFLTGAWPVTFTFRAVETLILIYGLLFLRSSAGESQQLSSSDNPLSGNLTSRGSKEMEMKMERPEGMGAHNGTQLPVWQRFQNPFMPHIIKNNAEICVFLCCRRHAEKSWVSVWLKTNFTHQGKGRRLRSQLVRSRLGTWCR